MSPDDSTTGPHQDPPLTLPRVSVVIPAHNEAANLPHLLTVLPEDVEVIVVDSRSTDGTVAVVQAVRPDATVLHHEGHGRGSALKSGLAAATGDIVVTLDADGSADPAEIPVFVEALQRGADVANGSRFEVGGSSHDITPLRAWGTRVLSYAATLLFRTRCTDVCYGYLAFRRRCLPSLQLTSTIDGSAQDPPRIGDGFDFPAVLKSRATKARLRVVEVPSVERPRRWGESNLNAWRDGARVLRALLVERLTSTGRPLQGRRRLPGQLRRRSAAGRPYET